MAEDQLFGKYDGTRSFCTDAFDIVQGICASSNHLPGSGEEFDFYQSYVPVQDALADFRSRILTCMNRLIRNFSSSALLDADIGVVGHSGIDHLERIIEINDELLEKISNDLDEASGIKKHATTEVIKVKSTYKNPAVRFTSKVGMISLDNPETVTSQETRCTFIPVTTKPQIKFLDKVDNSHNPFVPKIRSKPNAINPLPKIFSRSLERMTPSQMKNYPELFDHPYTVELEMLEQNEQCMNMQEPMVPPPLAETNVTIVETESQLSEMMGTLRKYFEIAVDLEHHHLRSFCGFTCLIQISTRHEDFIVDAFSLRHMLHVLNEIFTNPNVLKVFHGADLDIVWLQKDFGVYVVNMFDSYHASKLLGHPYSSLSFLLKHYCSVDADKQYQRADWRIRPLPEYLIDYARSDTHYLLYIFDCMRNELIQASITDSNNLLAATFQRSKNVCLKKYEKPMFSNTAYTELIMNTGRYFNNRQMEALKLLYEWRDRVAREEEESTGYVLPNHMLLKIAEFLPKEKQGIFGCCNPIPSHVKHNLMEIHLCVLKAREVSLAEDRQEEMTIEESYIELPSYDPESPLNCLHDMRHVTETPIREFKDILSLKRGIRERMAKNGLDEDDCCVQTFGRVQLPKQIIDPSDWKFKMDTWEKLPYQAANPFLLHFPQEMLTDFEKKIVLSKESEIRNRWTYAPVVQPDAANDDANEDNTNLRIVPTPSEIHDADDIVPLPRRNKNPISKSSSDKRQPHVATVVLPELDVSNVHDDETEFSSFDYEALNYQSMTESRMS